VHVCVVATNPIFNICTNTNNRVFPPLISEFRENGDIFTHDIVSTSGYTLNNLHDGLVVFVLAYNKGKWSDKYCAVEIIVDHLYVMPTPLRPSSVVSESSAITTTVESATSTPTTTPVKKPRLTSIDLTLE
jgi:hypothetical protein